jgi:exonuclease SbcD
MDDETAIAEKTQRALAARYKAVFDQAQKIAHNSGTKKHGKKTAAIPIVMTGHLYIAGSALSDNSSERAREVGRLSSFPAALLPEADYIALGHLHKPQQAVARESCRYSGAPLPMSFSEAPLMNLDPVHDTRGGIADNKPAEGELFQPEHEPAAEQAEAAATEQSGKSVVIVEFEDKACLRLVEIPQFRRLLRLRGDPDEILQQLEHIEGEAWLEVQVMRYEGPLLEFWNKLAEVSEQKPYKILIKKDMRESTRLALDVQDGVELRALTPFGVFEQRLKDEHICKDDADVYTKMFTEIYNEVVFENT